MAEQDKRPQAPGLKWRARRNGAAVPYWFADPRAIAAGYPVKAANLSEYAAHPARLIERAQRLQAEMLRWVAGHRTSAARYDGTFRSLLEVYQTDPESPFRTSLKRGTVKVYVIYLEKLIQHIGDLRIDRADGRDVRRWFAQWRTVDGKPDRDQLAAARMTLAVLKAALSFGIICRAPGCSAFKEILSEMEFDDVRPRKFAPTAEQIAAARQAAHDHGAPLRALAYAIQFETTLRQWDIRGQWLPLSDPRPSAVIAGEWKWVGLTWSAIDGDLILAKVRPTKTEDTSEVEVSFDLAVCPMVVEELAKIPPEARVGPLIVNPNTGWPYHNRAFEMGWRKDFKAAGMPEGMWNRDLRAGGITEGGKAGASKDDRRKLAGHTKEETTEIYDRDMVEAHRRVMASRKIFRAKNTP
jgi:hypothetical protein